MSFFAFDDLENKLYNFAYGEDENCRKLGGKLADDVQYIYDKLYEDEQHECGSTAKLDLIQRVMENDEETDEIMKSKEFKRITKQEIFDIVSLYAFCYGIVYAFNELNPGVKFE